MLEPGLVTDAYAATGDLPGGLPGLGPYPILQVFGGIISLIVLGVIGLLYVKSQAPQSSSAKASQIPEPGESAQLFFSGTAKEILDRLGAAIVILEKLSSLHYETREQIATNMAQTRHDIRNAIGEDAAEASRENLEIKNAISELQRTVSETNVKLGLLDQFMRIKVK